MSNTDTHTPSSVLYDADAEQKCPLSIEYEGCTFEVAHIFTAPSDDLLVSYDERRQVKLLPTGKNTISIENSSFEASVWL